MKRYTHLSLEERTLISHYYNDGKSIRHIAHFVGRSPSSIWREIARNSNKTSYNPQTACRRYRARRQKVCKIDQYPDLRDYILNTLSEGLSPEMIDLRLKKFGDLEGVERISYESIYRWLYKPCQIKQKLYKLLVQHHRCRGRRKRAHRGKIKDRVSIHERPSSILDRKEVGHWEADLMSFKSNKQHLLVVHERKTRYTAALPLQNKTAAQTIKTLLEFFNSLPKHMVKSVTFDNGTEFTAHKKITNSLRIPTYFCDVYASWQKGSIENMNGRFRRDLPRKIDIKSVDIEDLNQIVLSHNLAPRKVLNGLSPIEMLAKEKGRSIIFLFKSGVALHM